MAPSSSTRLVGYCRDPLLVREVFPTSWGPLFSGKQAPARIPLFSQCCLWLGDLFICWDYHPPETNSLSIIFKSCLWNMYCVLPAVRVAGTWPLGWENGFSDSHNESRRTQTWFLEVFPALLTQSLWRQRNSWIIDMLAKSISFLIRAICHFRRN